MKATEKKSACRLLDSASSLSMRRRRSMTAPLGFTSQGRSIPADVGLYFYAGSGARISPKRSRSFRAIVGSRTKRFV